MNYEEQEISEEKDLETLLDEKWADCLVSRLDTTDNYFDQIRMISDHHKWLSGLKNSMELRDVQSRTLIDHRLAELEALQQQQRNKQLEYIDQERQRPKPMDNRAERIAAERAELQEHLQNIEADLDRLLDEAAAKGGDRVFFESFNIIADQRRWLQQLRAGRTEPELLQMIANYERILERKHESVKPAKPNYGEQIAFSEAAIAEKEREIEVLRSDIERITTEVETLNEGVNEAKLNLSTFENANLLYKHFKAPTIPEYPMDTAPTDHEFTEEHNEILRGKRDALTLIRSQATVFLRQETDLRSQLEELLAEASEFQAQIVESDDSIRSMTTEGEKLQKECIYVQEQIVERTAEVKMLEKLKRDGEVAYAQLNERLQEFDGLDGSRLDIEKAIISLQSQLNKVEADIKEANKRIGDESTANEDFMADTQVRQRQFDEAVDWQREREDLQREYHELTEQIKERKAQLSHKEHRNDSRQATLAKYRPLLTKWKGKAGNIEVPADKTVAQLWAELAETRTANESTVKSAEKQIGELMLTNGKLEDELARRKTALEREISRACSEEARFRKTIEAQKAQSDSAEAALLQKIGEAKLRLAQKQLAQLAK